MKKNKKVLSFLSAFILVLFIVTTASAIIIVYSGGVTDDYTDIVFWWRCEGTTLGADDYSDGDTTAESHGAVAINTDAVKIGTYGVDVPGDNDYYTFVVSNGDILPVGGAGRLSCWFYYNTWVDSSYLFYYTSSAATTDRLRIEMVSSNEILMRWVYDGTATTFSTTDANLSSGTWYYLEFEWDPSNNYMAIYVDGDLKASNTTAITALPNSGYWRIGNYNSTASDYYLDNITVSDDKDRNLYALRNLTSSPR